MFRWDYYYYYHPCCCYSESSLDYRTILSWRAQGRARGDRNSHAGKQNRRLSTLPSSPETPPTPVLAAFLWRFFPASELRRGFGSGNSKRPILNPRVKLFLLLLFFAPLPLGRTRTARKTARAAPFPARGPQTSSRRPSLLLPIRSSSPARISPFASRRCFVLFCFFSPAGWRSAPSPSRAFRRNFLRVFPRRKGAGRLGHANEGGVCLGPSAASATAASRLSSAAIGGRGGAEEVMTLCKCRQGRAPALRAPPPAHWGWCARV